jgi:hypothetical protein
MADILISVSRTSERVPCRGCTKRSFKRTYGSGYVEAGSLYGMTFTSADALLDWVRNLGEHVILGAFDGTNCTMLDGGPIPTWDVEIYDHYRE